MRNAPYPIVPAGTVLTSTGSAYAISSQPTNIENIWGYSVQLVWTGTPGGTFSLQGSNDAGQVNNQTGAVTGITNWTTLQNGTVSAGGTAGNAMFNQEAEYYYWFQIIYTPLGSGGTGIVSARSMIKGL